MNIIVCMKRIPDTSSVGHLTIDASGLDIDKSILGFKINEWDEYALEEAVQVKKKLGGDITAVTIGAETSDDMLRRALALGADRATFQGLSGMGDLVLTCTGDLSRNRRVGIELGRGKKLDDILAGLHQVAEGVLTTRSAHDLAAKHGVRMPISEAVYQVLYAGLDPAEAARSLMTGQLRSERD